MSSRHSHDNMVEFDGKSHLKILVKIQSALCRRICDYLNLLVDVTGRSKKDIIVWWVKNFAVFFIKTKTLITQNPLELLSSLIELSH